MKRQELEEWVAKNWHKVESTIKEAWDETSMHEWLVKRGLIAEKPKPASKDVSRRWLGFASQSLRYSLLTTMTKPSDY